MKVISRLSNVNKIESASEVLGEGEIKRAYENCGGVAPFPSFEFETFEMLEKQKEDEGEEKFFSTKNLDKMADTYSRVIKTGLSKAEEVGNNLKKVHSELLKKLKEAESLINKEYYRRVDLAEDAFESFLDAKEQAEEIFKIKI